MNYFKILREEAGLSQSTVAKKLGYSTPQFISNWERHLSLPPINAIKKMSKMYKEPAERIFSAILYTEIYNLRKKRFAEFKKLQKSKG